MSLTGVDLPTVNYNNSGIRLNYSFNYVNSSYDYFLNGETKIYAIYYSHTRNLNGGDNQNGTGSLYSIPFTQAIDEFLASFNQSGIWEKVKSYYGFTTDSPTNPKFPSNINFTKSIWLDNSTSTNGGYWTNSTSSKIATSKITNGNFYDGNSDFKIWLYSILKDKLMDDDPDKGVYVVVLGESQQFYPTTSVSESFLGGNSMETGG